MRLLKQVSRQVGDNEYLKWTIIIPPSQVKELGWNEGEELESYVKGKTLSVKPLVKRIVIPGQMPYLDFKEKISALLSTKPEGLSWTEIRQKLQLRQKVPNNLWVKMMEDELGLVRRLDNKTAKVIWRLDGLKEAPEK